MRLFYAWRVRITSRRSCGFPRAVPCAARPHIPVRERRISLSMTQEEVCQLIRLDPDFVEKYKRRGKLCPVEDQDGKQYYNVLDFINLKDMQESKRIFYQTMEQAVPDTAITIDRE